MKYNNFNSLSIERGASVEKMYLFFIFIKDKKLKNRISLHFSAFDH